MDDRETNLRRLLEQNGVEYDDDELVPLLDGNWDVPGRLAVATVADLLASGVKRSFAVLLLDRFGAGRSTTAARAEAAAAAGIDVATITSAVTAAMTAVLDSKLDRIRQALKLKLDRQSRSTVAASDITFEDIAAVRGSIGVDHTYTSSNGDPEALSSLLDNSPNNTSEFWGPESEAAQRPRYCRHLREHLSAPPHLKWVDARDLVLRLRVRGERFKLASRNAELLVMSSFQATPAEGAVLGVEVRKALDMKELWQAEAEFYVFAHYSVFPFAQLITDLTTGGVLFYSDGKEQGKLHVKIHTLVGMSAVFAFIRAMLQDIPGIPASVGTGGAEANRSAPQELPAPKRVKLTGALSERVSAAEAVRMLCGIQSYDVACLEDLDDPNLYEP